MSANVMTSPGASTRDSCDRESELPSMEGSLETVVSAEGKMSSPRQATDNKSAPNNAKGEFPPQKAGKNGAESQNSALGKPPAHPLSKAEGKAGSKRKQNWQSVDIAVKGQREVRRFNNLPPRLRKAKARWNFQDTGSEGPSTQQVPPPIPPPMPPCLPPACHNQDFLPCSSYPPTYSRPPRPILQFKDEREQRCLHIRNQVEHYFKPGVLIRDSYLRQRMDEQGFVPISLIASFPKVREMTRDLDLLAEALQSSEVLEVCGEKVRPRYIPWSLPPSVHHVDASDPLGAASPPFGLWYFPVPPPLSPYFYPRYYDETVYVIPPFPVHGFYTDIDCSNIT